MAAGISFGHPHRPAGRQYNKRDAPKPSPLGKGDRREAVVEEEYRSPYPRQLFQLIVTASCASGGYLSVLTERYERATKGSAFGNRQSLGVIIPHRSPYSL